MADEINEVKYNLIVDMREEVDNPLPCLNIEFCFIEFVIFYTPMEDVGQSVHGTLLNGFAHFPIDLHVDEIQVHGFNFAARAISAYLVSFGVSGDDQRDLLNAIQANVDPCNISRRQFKITIMRTSTLQWSDEYGNHATSRWVPATRSSIEEIESVMPDELESGAGGCCRCSICLEQFRDEAAAALALARLPCKHVFHRPCIARWLERSHLCPLCRFAMPTN